MDFVHAALQPLQQAIANSDVAHATADALQDYALLVVGVDSRLEGRRDNATHTLNSPVYSHTSSRLVHLQGLSQLPRTQLTASLTHLSPAGKVLRHTRSVFSPAHLISPSSPCAFEPPSSTPCTAPVGRRILADARRLCSCWPD